MNKLEKLNKIAKEIENCEVCKIGKIGKAVPGEGNPDAKIVFLGEAPGKTEAQTGRPFVGRSGKLLREEIKKAGLLESEVYITSPVKYLPKRGTPTSSDILHGKAHLKKQLEVIEPKIVVLLGSVAAQGALSEKIAVLKRRGEIIEKDGIKYLATLHPAAVLRFPTKYKKMFEEDFRLLKKLSSF
jgi:DNA polymerase